MSLKRVFSNNKVVNYIDYNNLKNGCETLKTIKYDNNIAILKQFKNHQSWQTLSKAYFPYINDNYVESICPLTNLYDSTESYRNCDDNDIMLYNNNCQINKNILYPNGKIIARKQVIQQFPSNIDVSKWCKNNNKIINNITYNKEDYNCEICKTYKYKNCGLCRNARNLFI